MAHIDDPKTQRANLDYIKTSMKEPLLEREVYSAETGIYLYGIGGFRFDDTVVVGETPEVLTKAPKDLKSQTIP